MAEIDTIRAIVFQEGRYWIAQCIEVDVAAQGNNLDEAVERLEAALNYEADYTRAKFGEVFKGIDPAPDRYQKMLENCSKSFVLSQTVHVEADGHARVDLKLCA